jgi:ANTAR domain-containing protein
MDVTQAISEFIDEVLAARGAYGLDQIGVLGTPSDDIALARLRLTLVEALLAEGWTPPPTELDALDTDRHLLAAPDDQLPAASSSNPKGGAEATGHTAGAPTETATVPGQSSEQPEASSGALRDELGQMRAALASRASIEQAKGIAMERYGLGPDQAWAWLVRTSQQSNRKLRDIAQELVDSVANGTRHSADIG